MNSYFFVFFPDFSITFTFIRRINFFFLPSILAFYEQFLIFQMYSYCLLIDRRSVGRMLAQKEHGKM